jgi:hypothetical protein
MKKKGGMTKGGGKMGMVKTPATAPMGKAGATKKG